MQGTISPSEKTLSQTSAIQSELECPNPSKMLPPSMSHEKSDVIGGYCVKKCEEHDDAGFLTPWRNRLFRLAPLTSISSIGLYWIYFGIRVKFTMDAQNVAHKTYVMAWVFILIEMRTAGE